MYRPREYSIGQAAVTEIAGVVTKQPVSLEMGVTPEGSCALRVDLKASAVTVVGAISMIVQHQTADLGWEDLKTVAIAADGVFSVKFLDTIAGDQQYLPLRKNLRVVITTTNAGDEIDIDSIIVSQ